MKEVLGVAADLVLAPCPEFAFLLFFLLTFWENLGNLPVRAYADNQFTKTEKALKASLNANMEGYYVHMLTIRSMAERERRSRARLTRKCRSEAVYPAIARAFNSVRHLIEGGRTVPMRPATGEE